MGRMRPRRNYPNRGQGRAGQRKSAFKETEWYERPKFAHQGNKRGRKRKPKQSVDWDWENRSRY